jgi:hypothetical protein
MGFVTASQRLEPYRWPPHLAIPEIIQPAKQCVPHGKNRPEAMDSPLPEVAFLIARLND